jgi:hypothetical protein
MRGDQHVESAPMEKTKDPAQVGLCAGPLVGAVAERHLEKPPQREKTGSRQRRNRFGAKIVV